MSWRTPMSPEDATTSATRTSRRCWPAARRRRAPAACGAPVRTRSRTPGIHRGSRAALGRIEQQSREMSQRRQQIGGEVQRWSETRARILNENIELDQKLTTLGEAIEQADRAVLDNAALAASVRRVGYPVIAVVRVPPSAARTSQSTQSVRGRSQLRAGSHRRPRTAAPCDGPPRASSRYRRMGRERRRLRLRGPRGGARAARATGAMTPMSQTSPMGTPAEGSSVEDDRDRRPSRPKTARCLPVPQVARVDSASGS